MPEGMSISVNGQSRVPPGFRFHPTEEELLHYYLKKKVSNERIDLDVIRDVDLNKLEPWDIQEKCKIGTTPQNDWYFFSHKDKKYPTGTRTNRATAAGFWKATGRDKVIYSNCSRIGMRKTLVFYKGRAPHGLKSDWIMHEYRLDDNTTDTNNVSTTVMGDASQEEGWVVCRIFKKKNHHKTLDSPILSSTTTSSITTETRNLQMFDSCSNEGALEQILHYMGRSCKEENETNNSNSTSARFLQPINTGLISNINGGYSFLKLPSLESPNSTSSGQNCGYSQSMNTEMVTSDSDQGTIRDNNQVSNNLVYPNIHMDQTSLTNWVALDRLVASQLNGQTEASRQLSCFSDPTITLAYSNDDNDVQIPVNLLRSSSSSSNKSYYATTQQHDYSSEINLWSFARSSSSLSSTDPISHVSTSPI